MRLQATRASVTSGGGAIDALYRAAGGKPTLDQRFAKDKSLIDKVSGNNLVTFSRASSATFVDSDGLIKTASVNEARFDHDPATGESLGLLMEDARTNLLINSSGDSSTVYWVRFNMSEPTSVDGPAGANTAYQYLSIGGNVVSKIELNTNNYPSTVIGTQYTLSCYIKPVNYDIVSFGGSADGFGVNSRCRFELSTETVLIQPGAAERASIKRAGNGWYRLEVVTIPATAVADIVLFLDLGVAGTEPHTTSEGFQVYGFQIEEGTFATSIIPTTSSTVTRSADVATIEGTNFSPWYNQSEGTFVTITSSVSNLESTVSRNIFQIRDETIAANVYRQYMLYRGASKTFSIASRANDANSFSPGNAGDPSYDNDTLAYGYSSSKISKVFSDGSQISSTPSIIDWSTYNSNIITICSGAGTYLSGQISRLAYFPTLKTDQELINVTGGDTAIPIITYGITSAGGTFNLQSLGTVDYAVDWDSTGGYEASTSNTLPHTYTAGNYDLVVYSDDAYRPYFNDVTADVTQITSVAIGSGADLGTTLASAWYGASNMTTFTCPFDVTSSVTGFSNAWRDCSSLTSFPLLDTSSVTGFGNAWQECSSLTSFPLLDTSSVTNFNSTWRDCSNLTSFSLLDASSVTSFGSTWNNCNSLTSFPLLDTSSGTNFNSAWTNCNSLTSFPLVDTSSGTTFSNTWRDCSNLTSFPLLDTSSGTTFFSAWRVCSSLTTFPANMFDTTGTLEADAFSSTWTGCALTAQSIENILVSLDTNGATGVTLGINGGTNAAKTTWSTAAVTAYDNLITKGWTISFNA